MRRTVRRIRILLYSAFLLGFALAVTNPGLAEDAYRIRPGDSLRIVVLNQMEYNQNVVVQDDGKIMYFLIGEMQVAGLTPEELRLRIQEGLRSRLSDPQVLIVPRPHENEVFVGGQVNNPGRYTFREDAIGLRRALILAGGARSESADLKRVYRLRPDEEPTQYDLTQSGVSPSVRPGDVVYVPEKVRIRVTGNVQDPRVLYVDQPISVAYALALAGGIVDDKGSLSRLVILRADGTTETVQLAEDFWATPDRGKALLRHGDTLYVSNAYRLDEISVLGYVRQPGTFRVRGPLPIGRALALAGGVILEEAARDRAEILRLDGTRELVELKTGAAKVLVYPGETVRVGRRFRISWPLVFSALSTGAVIYSILRR